MLYIKIFLMFAIFSFSQVVFAQCAYNGRLYPVNSVLGPYVCGGEQWVIRR